MPTYALLGATGSTGSAVLNHLLTRSPSSGLTLNLYVRSPSKLYKLHPSLSPTLPKHPRVVIFEGTLQTPEVLADALRDADVVISCIGENENIPYMSVVTDAAEALIDTCERLRAELGADYKTKLAVVLSSSTTSKTLRKSLPALAQWLLETGLNWAYGDLRRAERKFMALYEKSKKEAIPLLNVIFAKPGGIVPTIQGVGPTGHELSTEVVSPLVGYADLGAGMVEMAERCEELGLAWKDVSVNATGRVGSDAWDKMKILLGGLFANLAPGIWLRGRGRGWW